MNILIRNKISIALFCLSASLGYGMEKPEGWDDHKREGDYEHIHNERSSHERREDRKDENIPSGSPLSTPPSSPTPKSDPIFRALYSVYKNTGREEKDRSLVIAPERPRKPVYNSERQDQLRALNFTPFHYPRCNHFFQAQYFQEMISKAYSAWETKRDEQYHQYNNGNEYTLEESINDLEEHKNKLKDLLKHIDIQKEYLKSHVDSGDIKKVVKVLKVSEERIKTCLSHAKRTDERTTYQRTLEKIQEQIKAFEYPFETYEIEAQAKKQIIEDLEERIVRHNNPADDSELIEVEEKFKLLADIRTKTIYNLGIKDGFLLLQEDLESIMRAFIPREDPIFGKINVSFIYDLSISRLEFPDYHHVGRDTNPILRYQDQIKELFGNFKWRLREDVFSFCILARLIKPLEDLNFGGIKCQADQLYKKAVNSDRLEEVLVGDQSSKRQGDEKIFYHILNLHKSSLTTDQMEPWAKAFFEDIPGGLLGHLLVGLANETVFSWQKAEELALVVELCDKIVENKALEKEAKPVKYSKSDISNGMIRLVHQILVRHMNWLALFCMGKKFGINWN
ncbi:hypothetical protein [Candidatus Odyssella acanthamoebae]|uniref:Uncharacterized protein n=1 Tax=Candidatus Odyssella acanthamoebae TaxID=91604 RepID=A0A077AX59_9PROT|nr:hypothetical protein [Candidatus Paracaedibacter acanthamoebae]AIK96564.1 hypothetical protein ID47_07220 [Candidatus Paracaedibacter acanthamoebae]